MPGRKLFRRRTISVMIEPQQRSRAMGDYFRNLLAVMMLGAAFGYIFAPQIDKVKPALLAWKARRARRKRGGVRW